MSKSNETLHGEALRFWKKFGFNAVVDPGTGTLLGIMIANIIALVASGSEQISQQQKALKEIGIPPSIWVDISPDRRMALFKLGPDISINNITKHFDGISTIYVEGDDIELPSGTFHRPDKYNASSIDDLSVLDSLADQSADELKDHSSDNLPQQIISGTLLDKFSMLGTGAELEASAVKSVPLLGHVALHGQATAIYAAPNTGKTLITLHLLCEAVHAGRMIASLCYYVNADDSQEGLGEKTAILDEVGIHTLSPGTKDFTTGKLIETLHKMVKDNACKGVVIIVDTLKKFVDLMDKRHSASFGDSVRQFVSKGGTFIALAHTRKNEGPNGESVYGGTSDIVEDFDAACLLVPLKARTPRDEKLVKFQFKKRRGRNCDEYYAYTDEPDCSYSERLMSVRHVEDDENDRFAEAENRRTDEQLIATIRGFIEADEMQKMALVKAVAQKTGVSRRSAMAVLERYTGDDPIKHHWCFAVGERGAKNYRAHPLCEMGS